MPLMRHQKEGVEFLLRNGSGIVAFEQGLGKTLVAIETVIRLMDRGSVSCAAVLCPNSLKRTWADELARFAPHASVLVVEGSKATRRAQLAETTATFVLLNYESARNDITSVQALLARRATALVLDESHFVKNQRSLSSVAARHFAPLAPHRILLTGTPITNRAVDIYTQVNLVAEGEPLGGYASFAARFGERDVAAEDRSRLAALVQPFMLRRTKEQCLDLPGKTFIDLAVELPPWQRRLYDATRDDLAHEIRGMSEEEFRSFVPTALVRLLRLSQIASNPQLVFSSEARTPAKFRLLDDLVADLAGAGRKTIIWSCYTETIVQLESRYASYGAASLHGPTNPSERQPLARRFQEDSDLRVLIANPAVAGTGFTLTAANHAIYESLNWRYDQYAQSQDRVHRIGQTGAVTYFRLLATETIERVIVDALERKADLARDIVGDPYKGAEPARLTRDAVLQMLSRDAGSVGTPR